MTRLRPDRESTATGYRWLDKVTDPYWRITGWWWERKWWLAHARPGESWKEARDRVRPQYQAAREADEWLAAHYDDNAR